MSDEQLTSELKLDGKILFIKRNSTTGEVVSSEELDGEICMKLLVAILDDAADLPFLERLFEAIQSS